ncbi:hypothetical protein HOA55_02815 [archaeon]|jgi:hypothetical protein|nr:hypothetical protein [archaeon]MBT6820261.1 hypothetical protein [archaeon]MBT7025465.1 hypothetical protein [archaeon]MBT7239315.1 hypothetical protein [archaeon]MBT7915242.1 hypothetical protein [Candidatus Bathyarchaeota archaeon]
MKSLRRPSDGCLPIEGSEGHEAESLTEEEKVVKKARRKKRKKNIIRYIARVREGRDIFTNELIPKGE